MYIKICLVAALVLAFSLSAAAQTETLTNAEVIEMTKVGLDKQLIIDKINSSKINFDTTTNGLIELRKADVDNGVIKYMLDKTKASGGTVSEPRVSSTRPRTP